MASAQSSDGSEDVSDFLRRVKELEHRRDREETERSRKLDEDIIQSRKEREARRAERARSLSPEKNSPANSPRALNSPRSAIKADLPASPLNTATVAPVLSNSIEGRLDPPAPEPEKTVESQTSPLASQRGSLSWQQKPPPPESLKIPWNPPSQGSSEAVTQDVTPSRSQIAQTLASKDPTWFRQPQDGSRGAGAFRRNIQDHESQATSDVQRKELAGMFQRDFPATDPPSAASTTHSEQIFGTTTNFVELESSQDSSTLKSSSNSLPTAQVRPTSPTKGMGGFVQSAMLKRSESVNKRWSAQAGPALNSRAAMGVVESQRPTETMTSTTGTPSPELVQNAHVEEPLSVNPKPSSTSIGSPIEELPNMQRPTLSSRPQTPNTSKEAVPPSSPSKRWSPLKSTWLESALNKPDVAPPPKQTYSPSQPAWMTQLAKAKQERASRDLSALTRQSNHQKSEHSSASLSQERLTTEVAQPLSPPQSKPKPPSLSGAGFKQTETDQAPPQSSTTTSTSKPATPPKKDFRSQLKTTQSQPDQVAGEELEFRNAFGKLKRTQTEKYVAPDELKDNILRGKAGLSVTGGPQKSARRDELKESLIKQREAMKAKAQDTTDASPLAAPKPAVSVPEAIAKKKALSKPETPRSQVASPAASTNPVDIINKKPESPGPLQPKPPHALNEAANNFNTNLASILAKGPPGHTKSEATSPRDIKQPTLSSKVMSQNEPQAGQLQHMTKARARGPKRRLPNAGVSTTGTPSSIRNEERQVNKPDDAASNSRNTVAAHSLRQGTSTLPFRDPSIPSDALSSPQSPKKVESMRLKSTNENRPTTPQEQPSSASPKHVSVKETTAIWGHPHGHVQLSPTRNPDSSPTVQQEIPEISRLQGSPKPKSPSITTEQRSVGLPQGSPKVPSSPNKAKPAVQLASKPETPKTVPSVDITQHSNSSEAEKVLVEFFGRIPSASSKIDIDVDSVVRSKAVITNNVQTVRKQIRELAPDGKLVSVPSQEEHVLISNRMYLCTHEFIDAQKSPKTESYLWIGAVVAEAAVEDAQLFARRAAKDAGGSLILVRQGKEPAGLFQAIGGILITRSGSTKDASSNYILCGRSHMGYLAFDEVPFSTSSLCSGFPYLIRASGEKFFLWKGSGCSTEELAAARLLSMDIGQTGKVLEVEEGKEPSEFFALFPSSERTIPKSAEHWKLKGAHEHYMCRLFQIEHSDRPLSRQNSGASGIWNIVRRGSQPDLKSMKQTQVKEVLPITQSDLKSENIYVLDAYFDLYIILGSASNSKPEAFTAALIFAKEYASLATSAEGRPHVPVATVVIEGVPKDMKRVFRRWDDDLSQTRNGPTQSGLKRGKSLKILPLSKALAALGSM